MKLWLPAVLLLLFLMPSFHSDGNTECPECQEMVGAPSTGIFVLVHDSEPANRYLEVVAYYDNASASPRRQPLKDSILIVEITNATGLQVLQKTYTDGNGTAVFKFNDWDDSCLNFKVLYCPYCVPPESSCPGFSQCLNFSHIETGVASASEIDDAADAKPPASQNTARYLPQVGTATWCPPPPPLQGTPEFCLPLILIFSLLCGALYMTGRNPFSGFNISSVRPGKHIRYQARGRGWSLNVTQMASTAVSIGQSIGTLASNPEEFKRQEASAIASRATMGMSQVHTAVQGKKKSDAAAKSAKAGGKEGGKASAAPAGKGGVVQAGGSKGGIQSGGGLYGGNAVVGRLGEAGLFSSEGVKALPEALGRMAMFVVMSSSIGRVVDSLIYATAGKALITLVFENRSMELADAKGQKAAMDGHVPYTDSEGNDRIADVKREAAITDKDGNVIGREVVFADSTGKSADGELTVRFDNKGNVEWSQFSLRGADGNTETFRVSAVPEGLYDVSKVDPKTGIILSHVLGADADRAAGFARDNPLSEIARPGTDANRFLDEYATFKEARNDIDNTIASLQARELQKTNEGLNDRAKENPEDHAALEGLRDEYAASAVAGTLGMDARDLPKATGGADPSEMASAVSRAVEAMGAGPGQGAMPGITLDMADKYRQSIMESSLPDAAKTRLAQLGPDKISELSEAGRLVQPEHTGDLMSTDAGKMFMREPSAFGPNFAGTTFSNEFKAGAIEYERGLEVQSSVGRSATPGYEEEKPSAGQTAAMYAGMAKFPAYNGRRPENKNFSAENDDFSASIGHEADAIVARTALENLPADKFPKSSQNEAIDALLHRDRERLKAAFGGKD
ncbi:hypothetical protein L0Y65_00705 [Candidatus Micrarchaeota archaeon]|nr:hypothetical protein [Candidatus Micrarchaeota archaeon]